MDAMTKWMIGVGALSGVIVLRANLHKFIVPEGFVGLLYRHGKYRRVLQSIDEAKTGNTLVMGTGIGLVPLNGKNGK